MFICDIGLYCVCVHVHVRVRACVCVLSLSGFGIRVLVASYNEFGSSPSFEIFWKGFSRLGVSSSLNFW